jgi:hypothetical protein
MAILSLAFRPARLLTLLVLFCVMLLLNPLAFVAGAMHWNAIAVFVLNFSAIVELAGMLNYLKQYTEFIGSLETLKRHLPINLRCMLRLVLAPCFENTLQLIVSVALSLGSLDVGSI